MQEGDLYLGWPADSLVEVEGFLVDLPTVKGIAHRCDPALCASGGSCCASHDVWLGRWEAERSLAVLDEPRLECEPELASGLFRVLGADTFAVRRGASGLCALAFRDGDGRVLCAVHAAALRRGIELRHAKPLCCLLWPLSLTRSRPAVLSVQEGAFRYPCNRPRPAGERGLDEGIAEVLRQAFGPAFADAAQDACSRRCT